MKTKRLIIVVASLVLIGLVVLGFVIHSKVDTQTAQPSEAILYEYYVSFVGKGGFGAVAITSAKPVEEAVDVFNMTAYIQQQSQDQSALVLGWEFLRLYATTTPVVVQPTVN